jgi:hypothetical protein
VDDGDTTQDKLAKACSDVFSIKYGFHSSVVSSLVTSFNRTDFGALVDDVNEDVRRAGCLLGIVGHGCLQLHPLLMRTNSIWKVSSNRYGRQNIRLTALITSVAGHDEQVVAADLRHADIAGKLCLYPHVGISTHNCRYVWGNSCFFQTLSRKERST